MPHSEALYSLDYKYTLMSQTLYGGTANAFIQYTLPLSRSPCFNKYYTPKAWCI